MEYIEIGLIERLARNLFTPFHYKNGKIKHAAFNPPPKSSEVSVLRLNYLSYEICFEIGVEQQNLQALPKPKEFVGFGCLFVCHAIDIFDGCADILSTPQSDIRHKRQMPFHADIIYNNYISEKGAAIPIDILEIMKELSDVSVFVKK